MLTIHTFIGPPLETNSYLVADAVAGQAILIDAPWQIADDVMNKTQEIGVTLVAIICTHGHWDHTMGLADMITAAGAPAVIHRLDANMLERPSFEPFSLPLTLTPVTPDRLLEDGDVVEVGEHRLTVIHTPGHTPGAVCLYDAQQSLLFSGDTLFAGSYGRTDLPGGDPEQMVQSLLRLRELPPSTRVYPGHGPATTLEQESWLQSIEEADLW